MDFCSKYVKTDSKSEQVRSFIEKLRSKNQTLYQQKQAAYAISLYLELIRTGLIPDTNIINKNVPDHVKNKAIFLPVQNSFNESIKQDNKQDKLMKETMKM